ncbi:MAG: rhodanese-like domain-containing protein [Eubacteriales bacterium]|nr:rhodanese-like domain-containing protein [Eubacteriales bacterium]
MKPVLRILSLAFAALLLSGCAAPQAAPIASAPPEATVTAATAQYRKITAEEAKARMDSGDEILVLDVRTQEEYDAGHIAGAVLLPNETIVDTKPDSLPDLNAEILIYCRSGNRSAQAAKKLAAMGYTNVYDFGGILDWPYDVVTD